MEYPQRKRNRLPHYDYGQNGAYFITLCTKERRRVLSHIVGDDAYIVPSAWGRIVEKYIQHIPEVETYVIMPDHIHLLIRIDSGAMWASPPTNKIADMIRSLKILTTKEIGKSIFQRSYYDHVIRNEQDFQETWEYIQNNPKRWVMTHGA